MLKGVGNKSLGEVTWSQEFEMEEMEERETE